MEGAFQLSIGRHCFVLEPVEKVCDRQEDQDEPVIEIDEVSNINGHPG